MATTATRPTATARSNAGRRITGRSSASRARRVGAVGDDATDGAMTLSTVDVDAQRRETFDASGLGRRNAMVMATVSALVPWMACDGARAGDEMSEGAKEALAMEGETFQGVELVPYVDLENGYALLTPKDWVKDLPNGISEIEIHPVSEYGGRRFKVQVKPYGKTPSLRLGELEEPEFATPEDYAKDVAKKFAPLEGEGSTNRGQAVSKVINSRVSDDGRYYYFEYVTDSMLALHFWGVVALGPGPVGSGRKLGRKDIISLTCQMPDDKGPEAAALLEHIVTTFKILDV